MEYYFGEKEVPTFIFSSRFALAVLAFFGFLAMNSQKVAIDMALPCMLNHTAINTWHATDSEIRTIETPEGTTTPKKLTNTSSASEYVSEEGSVHEKCGGAAIELDILKLSLNFTYSTKTGELIWPITRQKVLARTFYWGYVVGFLPCGWLSERIGGKFVFGFAVAAMSATTSLTSLSTRTHYFVLILLRFIAGIGAGGCFPAMHSMLGKWAPPLERSNLAAISYSGHMIGRSLTFPLVGALCQYGFLGGWPSVFYVLGAFGVLWAVLWLLCTKNFPGEHGRISYNEKRYIQATLLRETIQEPRKDISTPCFAIVTSLPFISVIISHFTFVWTLHAYEEYIPIYFSTKLDYEYRENGFFNMIPYLGMALFLTLSGMWADQLRSRGVMGTAAARKIMNTIGSCVPAGMLIGLGFINCTQWIGAVCMLTIGMACLGFQGSGFFVSHLDLAPQYAGFLMGLSGGLGSLAEFVEPYLVETLTPENTHEQWQTFFFISGCLGSFGGLCFLCCGSGEVQPWAKIDGYASSTGTPEYSTRSSLQSIDTITKSYPKLNSIGPPPSHYGTLDGNNKKQVLTRSLSDDAHNKRYSIQSNLISFDDPYYYRSLDHRKESQKKLLNQNPSYHSLEYPARRLTKSFEIEGRSGKVKPVGKHSAIEIDINDNSDEEVFTEIIRSSSIIKKKKGKEKKSSFKYKDKLNVENSQDLETLPKKKRKNTSKSSVQDDPPSADKPSTSSADSKISIKQSKRTSKRNKGSSGTIQSKDTYDRMSESKV